MKAEKKKNRRKFRFFNRPIKIGAGFAGVGVSLELGSTSIYDLIQDPKLIFWLEVLKYASYIIGVLFASGGVYKQAKEDLESIKIGEKAKEVAKKDLDLKDEPRETFEDEVENKRIGLDEVFNLAKDILSKRKNK